MRTQVAFFILAFHWILLTVASSQARGEPPSFPMIGSIHKGMVSIVEIPRQPDPVLAIPTLWQRSLTLPPRNETPENSYRLPVRALSSHPLRWRIDHGIFWGTGSPVQDTEVQALRIPLKELPLFEEKNWKKNAQSLRERDPNRLDPAFAFSWNLNPVQAAARRFYERNGAIGGLNRPPVTGIHFDFLPTGPDEILVFILHESKMEVWHGRGAWSETKKEWNLTWSAAAVEAFAADFQEAFQVFAKGEAYYFLTREGKLYAAQRPSAGVRQMKAIWTDAKRPIQAVLTEAENHRTFLFGGLAGEKEKAAQPFYFDLNVVPRIEPFELPASKASKRPNALGLATQLAWVLIAQKKIAEK